MYLTLSKQDSHPTERTQMAGFIEDAVASLDAHLGELRSEVSRLEAARTVLTDSGTKQQTTQRSTGSTPAKATATRRGPGRPRGSKGTRSAQALKLVQERPGISIPELAEAMKIEANYLYRVMPKLVEGGVVQRNESGGWEPVPVQA